MKDVIYREDAIKFFLSRIGVPAQVWVGTAVEWLKEIPSVSPNEEQLRRHREVANNAAMTCDAIEIGLVGEDGFIRTNQL